MKRKKPINSRFNKFRNESEEHSKFRERDSRFREQILICEQILDLVKIDVLIYWR